ncbi:MAG: TraR/DksA family transcriptional regulator [Telluria sp.]
MPISPQLHAEIERRLKQSREDLMDGVVPRISGDAPEIAPATHIAQNEDRPQAEMISHNEEHFAERETTLLHDIDAALARLQSGGYGICVECGREISEQRLLATPTVQTCIECQEMLEKEQRRATGAPTPPQI